jgi:hypothetical protein
MPTVEPRRKQDRGIIVILNPTHGNIEAVQILKVLTGTTQWFCRCYDTRVPGCLDHARDFWADFTLVHRTQLKSSLLPLVSTVRNSIGSYIQLRSH